MSAIIIDGKHCIVCDRYTLSNQNKCTNCLQWGRRGQFEKVKFQVIKEQEEMRQ